MAEIHPEGSVSFTQPGAGIFRRLGPGCTLTGELPRRTDFFLCLYKVLFS
jgi:hypothetical protein